MKKFAILITILALLVSGCGKPEETAPAPVTPVESIYTYGFSGEPATLNPILSSDSHSGTMVNFMFDSLLKLNDKLELEGELATSYETSEDGKVITFHLRDDVKFHDGEPLTAADVAYTMNAIKHPDYSGVRANVLKYVTEVVAVSDYVVEFHLSQVDATILIGLAGSYMGILPEHIFKDIPIKDLREADASWNPIGTGPYKFVEYRPGRHTVLTANEDYWGEGPYIETIMIKHFQDTQAVLAAFENGDIDYIPTIPVEDIDRLKSEMADEAVFMELPNNGYYYVGLKQNHKILKDLKVRKALMYLLDRQLIVNTIFRGYGTVVDSNNVPFSWAYSDDIIKYTQDIPKAEQLLAEAGWKKNDAGIMVNAKGEPLEFTMVSMSGDEEKANIIAMIEEQWKKAGITVNVEFYERSVLFNKYLDVGEFESYMWGWNLSVDPDCYNMFHSSMGKVNEKGEPDPNGVLKGFNDVEYINAEVDALLEAGRKTYDTEERKAIYGRIQQILNEELPYIFLYTTNSVHGMSKKFDNVIWSPLSPIDHHLWKMAQ